MAALSPPHLLARRYSSRSLLTAAAARIGAELLADSEDGAVPEELLDRYAQAFKRWLVEAVETATLPERMQAAGNDDDEDDDG